jgi:hypothetical protein
MKAGGKALQITADMGKLFQRGDIANREKVPPFTFP